MVAVDEHTLLCPICLHSYRRPRSLPCGHSFCENCVERQWQAARIKETLECSFCKQKAVIPDGDITELMLNKPLQEQVEEARYIHELENQRAKKVRKKSINIASTKSIFFNNLSSSPRIFCHVIKHFIIFQMQQIH